MRKITSFQRRQNRWVQRCAGHAGGWGCDHAAGLCWGTPDRGFIAWNRRARRAERRITRGKLTVKQCVTIPCPPYEEAEGMNDADR